MMMTTLNRWKNDDLCWVRQSDIFLSQKSREKNKRKLKSHEAHEIG